MAKLKHPPKFNPSAMYEKQYYKTEVRQLPDDLLRSVLTMCEVNKAYEVKTFGKPFRSTLMAEDCAKVELSRREIVRAKPGAGGHNRPKIIPGNGGAQWYQP